MEKKLKCFSVVGEIRCPGFHGNWACPVQLDKILSPRSRQLPLDPVDREPPTRESVGRGFIKRLRPAFTSCHNIRALRSDNQIRWPDNSPGVESQGTVAALCYVILEKGSIQFSGRF